MPKDQSRDINPNRVYGCHPPQLNSLLKPLFFPKAKEQPQKPPPIIGHRLRVLQRILADILDGDLPAKDHFAEHMRRRYRDNCKSSTLRSAAAGIRQFLSFYRQTGKQHIEQMTREDLEAFTEDMQDRLDGWSRATATCCQINKRHLQIQAFWP